MKLTDFISIKEQRPLKEKDIIGIDDKGLTFHVYSCACLDGNCKKWICSVLGHELKINIVKWHYKNPQ